MSDLAKLAKPFPQKFIRKNPSGGGDYVSHAVITQKLLATLGPYDFELVEIIRGEVPARAGNPKASSERGRNGTPAIPNAIVGAVCRITATIDGRVTRVEEVGDCEDPNNWPHDGARLKDAMSDSLKRAAMRLGLALHLWTKDGEYVLDKILSEDHAVEKPVEDVQTVGDLIDSHFPGAVDETPKPAPKEKVDALKNYLAVLTANNETASRKAYTTYVKRMGWPVNMDEMTEEQVDLAINFVETL